MDRHAAHNRSINGPAVLVVMGVTGAGKSTIAGILAGQLGWDFAEGDVEVFRDEVRLTYLHELGHYFGWDEDDLTARGLE